jgi:two-component system nitrogen regulation response regulator GlnG
VITSDCLPDIVRGETPRAAAARDGGGLPSSDLAAFIDERLRTGSSNLYAETQEMVERYLMTRVLRETAGNQTKAAEILGITRGKVRDRVSSFKISLDKNVTLDANGDT